MPSSPFLDISSSHQRSEGQRAPLQILNVLRKSYYILVLLIPFSLLSLSFFSNLSPHSRCHVFQSKQCTCACTPGMQTKGLEQAQLPTCRPPHGTGHGLRLASWASLLGRQCFTWTVDGSLSSRATHALVSTGVTLISDTSWLLILHHKRLERPSICQLDHHFSQSEINCEDILLKSICPALLLLLRWKMGW